MNGHGGAIIALFGGVMYVALTFVMGMEIGSLYVAIAILSGITAVAIFILTAGFPTKRVWLYPVMFSLPILIIGIIAIEDNFSFISIGAATLAAGFVGGFFTRWRQAGKS